MKAWIYICAIILVTGGMMVLADEPKTNAVPGAPAGAGAAIVPPPAASTPTSPAPAQPKITTAPRTPNAVTPPESSGTGHKGALTNSPPGSMSVPAVTNEVKSPDEAVLTSTSTVPTATEGPAVPPPPANATPPSESSGLSNMEALAIGLAILALAGGLAFFIWRRSHVYSHGSLITSAMNELKRTGKNEDKNEDKDEEKHEGKPVEQKPEKKFPPPMT